MVTQENYLKAYRECLDLGLSNPDYIEHILPRITGTPWNLMELPFRSYIQPGSQEFKDFMRSEILDAHEFEVLDTSLVYNVSKSNKTYKVYTYPGTWTSKKSEIILMTDCYGSPHGLYYTEKAHQEVKDILESWLKMTLPLIKEEKKKTRYVNIMLHSERSGFSESTIPLGSRLDIDISKNYMPDLPDEVIQEKLRSPKGGFLIFNGDPGTGKSSYLKYLIETMTDVDFVILDPNALQAGAEEFKNYLIGCTLGSLQNRPIEEECDEAPLMTLADTKAKVINSASPVGRSSSKSEERQKVFILEDAEKLLLKRSELKNPVNLSNVLNITDGIIGDLVKVKFVCTFNCDLSELDPALLRKGRLLHKYEFPKLSGETLKGLADSLGIPESKRQSKMSLADIYGWDTDTGLAESDKSKIGF